MSVVTAELGTVPEAPACPVCDRGMTRKTNREGRPFWGCNAWPQCKGVIDIAEPSVQPSVVDDFRRKAALELLKTLLMSPENREYLWARYLESRSEARLAVEMADDLVRELERAR